MSDFGDGIAFGVGNLTPVAQGSGSCIPLKNGRCQYVPASGGKLSNWRGYVRACAQDEYRGKPTKDGVHVILRFRIPPPKRQTREFPTVRPDLDKLVRAVLDALTGVIFVDDAQVLGLYASKRYSDTPGVDIVVRPWRMDGDDYAAGIELATT